MNWFYVITVFDKLTPPTRLRLEVSKIPTTLKPSTPAFTGTYVNSLHWTVPTNISRQCSTAVRILHLLLIDSVNIQLEDALETMTCDCFWTACTKETFQTRSLQLFYLSVASDLRATFLYIILFYHPNYHDICKTAFVMLLHLPDNKTILTKKVP